MTQKLASLSKIMGLFKRVCRRNVLSQQRADSEESEWVRNSIRVQVRRKVFYHRLVHASNSQIVYQR